MKGIDRESVQLLARMYHTNKEASRALRIHESSFSKPAIPEIALRIMRLVNDPNCDAEALEQVLLNDPAIVQKSAGHQRAAVCRLWCGIGWAEAHDNLSANRDNRCR